MALRHRLRRDALDETATSEQIQQAVDEVFPSTARSRRRGNGGGDTQPQEGPGKSNKQAPRQRATASGSSARPNTADVLSPPSVEKKSGETPTEYRSKRKIDLAEPAYEWRKSSAGAKSVANFYARRDVSGARIAIDATLRALASLDSSLRAPVNSGALRYKLLKHKQGTLFVFAIDASGSMAANRIARAKSTILKHSASRT